MVVYLDGFMGLNFLVDWMLLLGVNRLAGYPPGPGRTAAAAAVGSGYAGMCLLPGFAFLAGTLWRWVSLGVMSMTAFGLSRSALRRGGLFVLLSMALGGLAIFADSSCVTGLVGCSAALALLCRSGLGRETAGKRLEPVRIESGGKRISCLALCDTGNTLRDPLTGEPVLVADRSIARELLGLGDAELANPAETLVRYPQLRLRLMRYGTVGNAGMMVAVRCDRVQVGNRKTGGLVAFAPTEFGAGEYRALTGGYDG